MTDCLQSADDASAAVAVAPRVTLEQLNAKIAHEEYAVFAGVLTICVLHLVNGFTVTGESACASPENFNEELGKKFARERAMAKLWGFEGYLLRDVLHRAASSDFMSRLITEHGELKDKTEKLAAFMATGAFDALPERQRNLLNDQFGCMCSYLNALSERLIDLGVDL